MIDNERELISEYLKTSRIYKIRRLIALAVICLMLMVPLCIIYANGWWDLAGTGSVGVGWVIVGITVVVCSLGAVVIDLVWRKE